VNFRGEKRSNETHEPKTDPDSLLARKSGGKESRLSYSGNLLVENRNGLIVDAEVFQANGTAERDAALVMMERLGGTQPSASNSLLLEQHAGPDLPHRNCGGQVSHAHQIVGGAGEGKYPVHFVHPAMPNLSHERDRLQPAEAFFDPFPLPLTDGVARVPRGAAINRAAPASFQVLGPS
jgi:hypothetical protein